MQVQRKAAQPKPPARRSSTEAAAADEAPVRLRPAVFGKAVLAPAREEEESTSSGSTDGDEDDEGPDAKQPSTRAPQRSSPQAAPTAKAAAGPYGAAAAIAATPAAAAPESTPEQDGHRLRTPTLPSMNPHGNFYEAWMTFDQNLEVWCEVLPELGADREAVQEMFALAQTWWPWGYYEANDLLAKTIDRRKMPRSHQLYIENVSKYLMRGCSEARKRMNLNNSGSWISHQNRGETITTVHRSEATTDHRSETNTEHRVAQPLDDLAAEASSGGKGGGKGGEPKRKHWRRGGKGGWQQKGGGKAGGKGGDKGDNRGNDGNGADGGHRDQDDHHGHRGDHRQKEPRQSSDSDEAK